MAHVDQSVHLGGQGEFPAQKASNAENVSIWWRHHAMMGVITHPWSNFNGGLKLNRPVIKGMDK